MIDKLKERQEKTLRDEIAISAMQGLLANADAMVSTVKVARKGNTKPVSTLAMAAYSYADAMLKAREVQND